MASLEDPRVTKLTKFWNDVLYDRRALNSSRDGGLFLEALKTQRDPATCVCSILSSPKGLTALQAAMRFDTSPSFLNSHASSLLTYLQSPTLKNIDSGSVIAQIVLKVVDPPFFWDAYTKAFKNGLLEPAAATSYAWLLLQLICLPHPKSVPYVLLAKSPEILDLILRSSNGETRILGEKIKHYLPLGESEMHINADAKPGGRHDNDHSDYRKISIMPTADELLSQERPFFRTADYVNDPDLEPTLKAVHLDNQFRLLREDMLGEIREEIRDVTGAKTGRHKGTIVEIAQPVDIYTGNDKKRQPWGIALQFKDMLPPLKKLPANKRKFYLSENKHILRQGNIACLLIDNEAAAFPSIFRIEDDIAGGTVAGDPGRVILRFQDDKTLPSSLAKMRESKNIKLVQLDSSIFAFEPFLRRLQGLYELTLAEELLHWNEEKKIECPPFGLSGLVHSIQERAGKDLKDILKTQKSIILDDSQMRSLCACFMQRVSLVQGPPGTGKSFLGALVAKVLHDYTSEKILVVCFTNHALDQFLEDLMDIGIPQAVMVRLGSKSTDRTKPLSMREQKNVYLNQTQRSEIDRLKKKLDEHEKRLKDAFARYKSLNVYKKHLLEHLEFLSGNLPFFEAFTVPPEDEGMKRVGRKGKEMDTFYILDRWIRGEINAGSLQHTQPKGAAEIWNMPQEAREKLMKGWQHDMMNDLIVEIQKTGRAFNEDQTQIQQNFDQRDAKIIERKRIIACTTNGAASYSAAIHAARPGVVLVEEAGEILEAHILTSMGPNTKSLILIGDHLQLRPKCSYELSVAQGDGFDLNRSLFERLVLRGFPHITLAQQHRMRSEISSVIRHMTYPDLIDASSTLQRPNIRGLTDNFIFINHSEPEIELKNTRELRDGKTSTKQNEFEAQMALKCVRYLAQQGYGTDQMVVLTPYLGQLKLIRDHIAGDNDPILSDLDRFDLIRAGLLSDLSSKTSKPSLRISTIDNYQGEERDIVITSLTRSNKSHDIGFMSAAERLNVLLSRARNGMIIIGNSDNFMNARKGREIWRKFFDFMKINGHVYEGLPVKCEKHPDRTAALSNPEAFDIECPDGGCREPCAALLSCQIHKCPSSCHQIFDHSKIKCKVVMKQTCSNGHGQTWRCHESFPRTCRTCEKAQKEAEKKAQKDLEAKLKRDELNQKYLKEVAKITEEFENYHQNMKDSKLQEEQRAILAQKRKDLSEIKARAGKQASSSNQDLDDSEGKVKQVYDAQDDIAPAPQPQSRPKGPPKLTSNGQTKLKNQIKTAIDHNKSPSKTEWQRQKDQENEKNPAIDAIMEMIGLEDVKSQVLRIKAKVDTSKRQGTDLKKERLGLTLLGNPGTGKTTVARHYASVLTSLDVLPGDGFVETTGSRLAHGGVTEVKNHLKLLEDAEGGVYFIDEAYQLAEGHNFGGKTVLDFLLAEIENTVGKIVFVFAGYRKQMEKFFEHNPGFSSRIPYTLHFEDYNDDELLEMLRYKMSKFFKDSIDVEGGVDGLYMRIIVRRLGRGRGRDGFGNARALENLFARIRERQADRLSSQRRQGLSPDDFMFTKEDLIGPDPSQAILKSEAWTKLQKLTGLKAVKNSISFMIDLIKTNYERELKEAAPVEVSLNRVFLGSPGTGKTTVAKLYGRILADIGLLSNGEVVTKNPADFIGNVIGQSEANTKAILATTVGKVLIIDEAYMLYSGASTGGAGGGTDIYKTAVIDTIVAEVQSVPGEDRCVLLLGYEDQMVEMFQNVNPGLTRRFQLSDAFHFEDFNDAELQEILEYKLKIQDLSASPQAVSVAIDVLSRARNGLNFGNGGDVENLISKAKSNYQSRQSKLDLAQRSTDFVFEPQDFDPDFDRAAGAETNLQELFKDVIGCAGIISKLDGYLKVAKGMKAQGLDPRGQIPMNFIFKGPPGTGKTTTARKFGQVYYDLGFLSQVEVVECSATDLIGQYVGQTGPKTIKQLERGLGKVLFIDEAYRLGEGLFGQEAVNELVDTMTKPKFAEKLVIILAGYDNDMNNLLQVNEGLSSRFADEIIFPSLNPSDCIQLLEERLKQNQIAMPFLKNGSSYQAIFDGISELAKLPAWGNARDIQTLAKSMVRDVYQHNTTKVDQLTVSIEVAQKSLQNMLSARCSRNNVALPSRPSFSGQVQQLSDAQQPPSFNFSTSTATKTALEAEDELPPKVQTQENVEPTRDTGVSDEIWAQLQLDKKLAELRVHRFEAMKQEQEKNSKLAQEAKTEAARQAEIAREQKEAGLAALRELEAKIAAETEAKAEALLVEQAEIKAQALAASKRREEERIKMLEAQAERERIRKQLERREMIEREKRKKEQQAQAKLKQMGVCPVGYQWIKQSGGYRCAGGSHWVTDGQLGL